MKQRFNWDTFLLLYFLGFKKIATVNESPWLSKNIRVSGVKVKSKLSRENILGKRNFYV
jgi:hypothetical protein